MYLLLLYLLYLSYVDCKKQYINRNQTFILIIMFLINIFLERYISGTFEINRIVNSFSIAGIIFFINIVYKVIINDSKIQFIGEGDILIYIIICFFIGITNAIQILIISHFISFFIKLIYQRITLVPQIPLITFFCVINIMYKGN